MLCIQPRLLRVPGQRVPADPPTPAAGVVDDLVGAPNVKLFCCGSVASIFISFSGVTLLNSRLRIVVYADCR